MLKFITTYWVQIIFLLGVLYVGFEMSNQDKKTLKKQLAL